MKPTTPCHLQLAVSVRLRREAWGGFAFDRTGGDLLELDPEAFALLTALQTPRPLPTLEQYLRHLGHHVLRPELVGLVRVLERRGFVCRTTGGTPPLPADRWTEADVGGDANGLRAPLVAHWAVTYRCNLHCPFCYSESGPHRPLGPRA